MVKKIVIGNWKMNPLTLKDAEKLFGGVARGVSKIKKTKIIICPPAIYLEKLKKLSKKISLGAQNAFIGDFGPFTGEISPEMLSELGVEYVILGHSERRALGEKDLYINKKLRAALTSSLTPILCVGEETREETHEYFNVVRNQIKECLQGINKALVPQVIIAYEPVWALSSTANRKNATAHDSLEMSIFIRKTLSDLYGPEIISKVKILYGGSVNEKDVKDFLENGGVDGVLCGKASLTAEKFLKIIQIAEQL